MNSTDIDKLVRSYRLTVVAMSIVIVTIFSIFVFVMYQYLPDTVYKVTHQAVNDVLDEREAQIKP